MNRNDFELLNKNIVYFDLETQKTAGDVGGWSFKDKMLMSVGVTYSTQRASYHIYSERDVEALIQELQRADLVVGSRGMRAFRPVSFPDRRSRKACTSW